MKKIIVLMAVIGVLAACGGSDKGSEKPKATDITKNPDYIKGRDAIEKTPICLTCHKIDEKVQGPAWREVANRYADSANALSYLTGKIMNGGTGVWGDIYMPPNPISKEDAEAIVKYIMLLKNK